jgi:hypothetical protein
MTAPQIDAESEIIDGVDVDHLDDRPDKLEHVAIEESPDGDLQALPFTDPGGPPGYVEIDVDLMQYDDVCRYVETVTDYDRRIDFTRVPKWPSDGPTATEPDGW